MLLVLSGCGLREDQMDDALQLRARLGTENCSFDAKITADYGDSVYTFVLHCCYDSQGELSFSVKEPTQIAGISGHISGAGGKLEFDGVGLSFALLADGQLSPVAAPWVMMKALHSGYMTSAGADGEYTRVTVKDSYEDDAMTVDIWLNQQNVPVQAEILWDNLRILTIAVENFTFE